MTTETEKPLRDFTLSVRLRADLRERLGFVADRLGVAPSTLASLAIGHYVAAQHAALTASEKTGLAISESIAEQFQELFKSMDKSMDQAAAAGASAVAKLDGAAAGAASPSNLDTYK